MTTAPAARARCLRAALCLAATLAATRAQGADAGPTRDGAAGEAGECRRPRVLIVLDKSSSMVEGKLGATTKWEVAKSALTALLATHAGTVEFGLMVFPDPSACSPGTVKSDCSLNNDQSILAELTQAPPATGALTPMAESLDAAGAASTLQDPSYSNNILLITDGRQYCEPNDPADRFAPVTSASKLAAQRIRVHAVGFGSDVDALALNRIAAAAGTRRSPTCNAEGTDVAATNQCYYQANDINGLTTALNAIVAEVNTERCDGLDNDCDGVVDGPDALCDNGGTCVDGTCTEPLGMFGSGGCRGRISPLSEAPGAGLLLLLPAALMLALAGLRRRGR